MKKTINTGSETYKPATPVSFFALMYFLLVCAVLGAVGIAFRSSYVIIAAAVVALCFLADALFFVLFCRKISIVLSVDRTVIKKGESAGVLIRLKNPTPLVIGKCSAVIYVKNFYYAAKEQRICFSAVPFWGGNEGITVIAEKNGNITAGVKNVYISDFFCIFRKNIVCDVVCTVAVIPNVGGQGFAGADSQVKSDSLQAQPVKADNGDIDGIREYTLGDRLNNVHWKLSASRYDDELFVRSFADDEDSAVIVLFEYWQGNTDSITDAVYTTSNALVDGGTSFTLMWVNGGDEMASHRYIKSHDDIMRFIFDLYTSYPQQNENAAMDYFKMITGSDECIYIDSSANVCVNENNEHF